MGASAIAHRHLERGLDGGEPERAESVEQRHVGGAAAQVHVLAVVDLDTGPGLGETERLAAQKWTAFHQGDPRTAGGRLDRRRDACKAASGDHHAGPGEAHRRLAVNALPIDRAMRNIFRRPDSDMRPRV